MGKRNNRLSCRPKCKPVWFKELRILVCLHLRLVLDWLLIVCVVLVPTPTLPSILAHVKHYRNFDLQESQLSQTYRSSADAVDFEECKNRFSRISSSKWIDLRQTKTSDQRPILAPFLDRPTRGYVDLFGQKILKLFYIRTVCNTDDSIGIW